ncbi:DUF485 domain-containing protein [Methylophilaceae bacterium]|jgi:uncharacterized membrane protein (DUF485 family)|nr:DUF485 domain-containing protein [Methylophilaceae bacterium]|tara:strand:+ start:454 stop:726 length:273 start_codon:yes stop_codon:yes gene_type:complete
MHKEDLFKRLINKKKLIIRPLLFLTVIPYLTFICIIAFYPHLFGNMLLNSSVSIGIILGFILIIIIWVITLLYVYLANKHIEPIIKELNS